MLWYAKGLLPIRISTNFVLIDVHVLFKLRKLFVIMTNDFDEHFVFENHGFENSKLGIFLNSVNEI